MMLYLIAQNNSKMLSFIVLLLYLTKQPNILVNYIILMNSIQTLY